MPGRQRNPEDAAPSCVFESNEPGGIAEFCHFFDAKTEIHAHQGRRRDAEREQPLKDAGALAATRCRKTLRQIERNHHPDQSGTNALQQAANNQRLIAVRESNDWNADDEQNTAKSHEELAPHPISQRAREQSRDDAAEEDCCDHGRKLARIQTGSRFQIGQCAGNNADVYSVQQAAEPRDKQEEAIVAGFFVVCHAGSPFADLRNQKVISARILRQTHWN